MTNVHRTWLNIPPASKRPGQLEILRRKDVLLAKSFCTVKHNRYEPPPDFLPETFLRIPPESARHPRLCKLSASLLHFTFYNFAPPFNIMAANAFSSFYSFPLVPSLFLILSNFFWSKRWILPHGLLLIFEFHFFLKTFETSVILSQFVSAYFFSSFSIFLFRYFFYTSTRGSKTCMIDNL